MKTVDQVLQYQVPIITSNGSCADGSCSGPFNAEQYLPFLIDAAKEELLIKLDQLTQEMHELDGVDWCGLYMKIEPQQYNELYEPALLKIAYRGAVSRGLFPLTEDFAKNSNNSTVGLSGKPIKVDSVKDFVSCGGSYYKCDVRVKSEYCHPLFDEYDNIIGIVDVESFVESTFSKDDLFIQVCDIIDHMEFLLAQFVKA